MHSVAIIAAVTLFVNRIDCYLVDLNYLEERIKPFLAKIDRYYNLGTGL